MTRTWSAGTPITSAAMSAMVVAVPVMSTMPSTTWNVPSVLARTHAEADSTPPGHPPTVLRVIAQGLEDLAEAHLRPRPAAGLRVPGLRTVLQPELHGVEPEALGHRIHLGLDGGGRPGAGPR